MVSKMTLEREEERYRERERREIVRKRERERERREIVRKRERERERKIERAGNGNS